MTDTGLASLFLLRVQHVGELDEGGVDGGGHGVGVGVAGGAPRGHVDDQLVVVDQVPDACEARPGQTRRSVGSGVS